jgi:hypothetical protein
MDKKDLTFDEFRSFQERERQRKRDEDDVKTSKSSSKSSKAAALDDNANKSSGGIGEFLELPQVQTFVAIMLVLDTFSALCQALLSLQIANADRSGGGVAEMSALFGLVAPTTALTALNTFSGFTLVFFSFEVGAILALFGITNVSGHWGYVLDAALVGTQLYGELSGYSLEARLLNMLRFWRIARLMVYMVNTEKAAHEATQDALQDREADIRKFKGDIARAQVELAKEKEARTAVDEMLNQYKEDLDTMNEALKIAAMDIVEVAEADDDLLSDEEDDDGGLGLDSGDVDDEGFTDAPSGRYDKARNKAELYSNARKDRQADGGGGGGGDNASITSGSTMTSRKSGQQAQAGVTFVVNDDGTFQPR